MLDRWSGGGGAWKCLVLRWRLSKVFFSLRRNSRSYLCRPSLHVSGTLAAPGASSSLPEDRPSFSNISYVRRHNHHTFLVESRWPLIIQGFAGCFSTPGAVPVTKGIKACHTSDFVAPGQGRSGSVGAGELLDPKLPKACCVSGFHRAYADQSTSTTLKA